MLKPYLFVFAVVVVFGGIQGFRAGSTKSLVIASLVAACLAIGAYFLDSKPTVGLVLAGIGSLAIAGRFLPAFIRSTDKAAALWPAAILSLLSIVAIVWIVLVFLKRA